MIIKSCTLSRECHVLRHNEIRALKDGPCTVGLLCINEDFQNGTSGALIDGSVSGAEAVIDRTISLQ